MARVAFLQHLGFEFLGVGQLAAALKRAGHRVRVFINRSPTRAADAAAAWRPDLACFSCMTGSHPWSLSAAGRLKAAGAGAFTLFGGPHPTFFPEIARRPEVDAACIGEGEACLLALAAKVDAGEPLESAPNLCRAAPDGLRCEPLAPLAEDLDALPWPDRGAYYRPYPWLNLSRKAFFAGRGCPFDCTFCFNRELRALYRGKGRYVRWRSPAGVVEEIVEVRRRFGLRAVLMQDDTFTLNKAWLAEFAPLYARRVGLPLACLARADTLDGETVRLLQEMNCRGVFMGVESGSERLRREVLGKAVSDDQIREAAARLRARGMRVRTYNMLGLPGESLDDAWATVRLNAAVRPDFPWCALFQPYPGTRLGDRARAAGLVREEARPSFFRDSPLALPRRREVENLHKLFFLAVKAPALEPLVRRLIKLPANPLFDLLFRAGYAWGYMRTEFLRAGEVLSIARRNASAVFERR